MPATKNKTERTFPSDVNLRIDCQDIAVNGATGKEIEALHREACLLEKDIVDHQQAREQLLVDGMLMKVCDVIDGGEQLREARDILETRIDAIRQRRLELLPQVVPFFKTALQQVEDRLESHFQERFKELGEMGIDVESRTVQLKLRGKIASEDETMALRAARDKLKGRFQGVEQQAKGEFRPGRVPVRWSPAVGESRPVAQLAEVQ